jgi:hypothetical protein
MKIKSCLKPGVFLFFLSWLININSHVSASTATVLHTHKSSNIIENGDFENGTLSPWLLYILDPVTMAANAAVADGECLISGIEVSESTEAWYIQLNQTFTEQQKGELQPGHSYRLSFDARALEGNKTLYVFLGQNTDPWIPYIHQEITIDSEMRNYSFELTPVEVYSLIRLLFGAGSDETSVVLDNICLEETSSENLKVMSFNILEGGKNGLDRIFQIIEENDADVVLIQESSGVDDNFINVADQEGFYCVQNDIQSGEWWSLYQPAVLSRYPIISSEIYHMIVCTEIEIAPGVIIKAHSCHLSGPGPLDHDYHMKHIINAYLRYDKEKFPTIIGGDFNEWPFQTEVTGQLTETGFTRDVYDELVYIYSWRLTAVPGTARVIGDHINDPDWPSDHNAIFVEYYMPQAFTQETQTFTLTNNYQEILNLSAQDFIDHFPAGDLTSVQFLKTGAKGSLMHNSTLISDNDILSIADLDNVTYQNATIGIDEIEWLGYKNTVPAYTSSFLYLENIGTITYFDRSKCLYDVDFLNSGTPLYFGNNDVFFSTSISELNGAEFVKFPTYIANLNDNGHLNNYFLLNLKSSATIYIAFDNRNIPTPAWIANNFTRLYDSGFSSDEHSYNLYRKYVPAGDFTFGSNGNMNWDEREYVDHFVLAVVPGNPPVSQSETLENSMRVAPIVYSNPSTGHFAVDLVEVHSYINITISDIAGRTIDFLTFRDSHIVEIELSSSPGVYFLTIDTECGRTIVRIVKE